MRRTLIATVLGAAVFISQTSCGRTSERSIMNATDTETVHLPDSFKEMQTVCFGRFLMEIPQDADVVYGRQEVEGELEFYDNGETALDDFLAKQLEKLERDRYLITSRKEYFPRYGEVTSGPAPGQRTIFGTTDYATYSITSYIPISPHLFVLDFPSSIDTGADIAAMDRVIKHLRPRSVNEIPKEVGVCLNGAFVSVDPEFENISFGVRLHDHPDVHFSVATIKHREHLPASSMIEERIRQAQDSASPTELLWHQRIKHLRRGVKVLGEWRGEEVAARLPSQEGIGESHQFMYVSLGELNNPYKPHIDIELVSGVKKNARGSVKPSLSDQQMLLLWDTLLNSIRVRPTVPVESKPVPKAPLGAAHVTGRTCPQTGWWVCDEPGVIAEARRKLIREGELMPRTTVKLERSSWEKLKGRPEQTQRATVWTLEKYAHDRDLDQNGV